MCMPGDSSVDVARLKTCKRSYTSGPTLDSILDFLCHPVCTIGTPKTTKGLILTVQTVGDDSSEEGDVETTS